MPLFLASLPLPVCPFPSFSTPPTSSPPALPCVSLSSLLSLPSPFAPFLSVCPLSAFLPCSCFASSAFLSSLSSLLPLSVRSSELLPFLPSLLLALCLHSAFLHSFLLSSALPSPFSFFSIFPPPLASSFSFPRFFISLSFTSAVFPVLCVSASSLCLSSKRHVQSCAYLAPSISPPSIDLIDSFTRRSLVSALLRVVNPPCLFFCRFFRRLPYRW